MISFRRIRWNMGHRFDRTCSPLAQVFQKGLETGTNQGRQGNALASRLRFQESCIGSREFHAELLLEHLLALDMGRDCRPNVTRAKHGGVAWLTAGSIRGRKEATSNRIIFPSQPSAKINHRPQSRDFISIGDAAGHGSTILAGDA